MSLFIATGFATTDCSVAMAVVVMEITAIVTVAISAVASATALSGAL